MTNTFKTESTHFVWIMDGMNRSIKWSWRICCAASVQVHLWQTHLGTIMLDFAINIYQVPPLQRSSTINQVTFDQVFMTNVLSSAIKSLSIGGFQLPLIERSNVCSFVVGVFSALPALMFDRCLLQMSQSQFFPEYEIFFPFYAIFDRIKRWRLG